jgi:hypothetical protein
MNWHFFSGKRIDLYSYSLGESCIADAQRNISDHQELDREKKPANGPQKHWYFTQDCFLDVVSSIGASQANINSVLSQNFVLRSLQCETADGISDSWGAIRIPEEIRNYLRSKNYFPNCGIDWATRSEYRSIIHASYLSLLRPVGFVHGFSRQPRDFVAVFWCFRQWISLFLQEMLFHPDSKVACENAAHPRNHHWSMIPDRCGDRIRLNYGSNSCRDRFDSMGWVDVEQMTDVHSGHCFLCRWYQLKRFEEGMQGLRSRILAIQNGLKKREQKVDDNFWVKKWTMNLMWWSAMTETRMWGDGVSNRLIWQ